MAKVVTDNQYYKAIADAIRALLNTNKTYTPAEMAPAIIGYLAGGIDLSDVETYFITDVVNAMKYVKELGTDDWVHHIIMTDTHFMDNYGHSTAIVKAMQDSGYFSKLIHLGDIADNGEEDSYTGAVANYGQFNGDMLFAIGNHDVVTSGWQTYWYNNLLSNDTDIVVDSSSNYNYYWDDAEHHIRYIVYKYNKTADNTYAINRIKDAPEGYSVLTLCHYRDRLRSLILVPLLGHKIDYIGNITGHYHVDLRIVDYANMYHDYSFNNDGWINDNENYVKEDGTSNSQAITIMSINTSTRNVKFYRIGKTTTQGKQWEYTYVQGGSVEEWIQGYYWGTGTTTASANAYYSTKVYPALDTNNSVIHYKVSSTTGLITNLYVLGLSQNGDYVSRMSVAVSPIWNRRGWFGKTHKNKFTGTTYQFLVSVNSNGQIASTDDIVLTTEHITLGRAYSEATWETGKYLKSDGNESAEENSVASYGFDVLPNTMYRFYVDDTDWTGSNYMYAFFYKDGASIQANSYPVVSRRVGTNTAGSKEFTVTTNADEYYCRISVRNGLGAVENFASKCHWEVVQ